MHKNFLRSLCLLLCICLLVSLFGCAQSGAGPGEDSAANAGGSGPSSDGAAAQELANLSYAERLETVKKTTVSDVTAYLDTVYAWYFHDGTVWAYGPAQGRQGGEAADWCLAAMDTAGKVTNTVRLTLPAPPVCAPGQQAEQYITDLVFGAGGSLYLLLKTTLSTRDADGNVLESGWQLTLHRLQEDGTLAEGLLLQLPDQAAVPAVLATSHSAFLDENGELWLTLSQPQEGTGRMAYGSGCLLHFGADGSCRWQQWQQGWLFGLAPLPDNRAVFGALSPFMDVELSPLYLVDGLDSGTPSAARQDIYPLGQEARQEDQNWDQLKRSGFFLGDDGGQLTVCCTNAIWRFALETGGYEKVLTLQEYGLVKMSGVEYLQAMFQLEENRFLGVTWESEDKTYQFHQVVPGLNDDALLAGRQTVTLGVTGSLSARVSEMVSAYNFSDPTVYVQVVEYTDEAAAKVGLTSGTALLNRDMAQGASPDILVLDDNTQSLAARGLLLDLYPYIDADPELARADLLPGLLRACEHGGALPSVVPVYMLLTASGDPARLGQTPGWTWQQYRDACAADPAADPPIFGLDRRSALQQLLSVSGTDYLDVAGGVCRLDSPGFIRLLEDSAAYPAVDTINEDPKEALCSGRALLQIQYLYDFRTLLQLRYELDGDFVLKGLPDDAGIGAAFMPRLQLGISAGSKDPDAAWQFLRYSLLPEFQNTVTGAGDWYGLPARRDSLQKLAAAAAQPAQGFVVLPGYLPELTDAQLEYWRQGVPEQDSQLLLEQLEQTARLAGLPQAVRSIVEEEAQAFYAGQRTAAEAAAIMQDRVQTYLYEQA